MKKKLKLWTPFRLLNLELKNSEEYQKDVEADGNVVEGSELNNKLKRFRIRISKK